MSLRNVANSLKHRARVNGAAGEDFAQGARIELKSIATPEAGATRSFEMTITRPIKSTRADRFARWQTEVARFQTHFGITRETFISAEFPTEQDITLAHQYSAVVTWCDTERQSVYRMPQNAEEIKEWARGLGPGTKIRNTDFSTGAF